MRKVYCDSCQDEIVNSRGSNTVGVPLHALSQNHLHGYVDSDNNSISGRIVDYDLCNKCFNDGWFAFVKATGIE
jgi:hypothetical protein